MRDRWVDVDGIRSVQHNEEKQKTDRQTVITQVSDVRDSLLQSYGLKRCSSNMALCHRIMT